MNIAPFAESTINLVAEINYGLDAQHAVYLRKYAGGEAVKEYREHWQYFRPVLRGIGVYSLGLVTLSKSDMSGKERAQEMADFLERLFADALVTSRSRLSLSPERLREILANIRGQKTLLDALGAAQPIVNEVARFSGEYLDIIKDSQDRTQAWLLGQIEADHEMVLAFNDRARQAQARYLYQLTRLSDYRQGRDDQALTELLESDRELHQMVPDAARVQPDDLQAMEDRLVARLTRTQELKEHIAFDIDSYARMTGELDELVRAANNNLRRTRLTIHVWAGAHRRLAAGITNPAKINMMSVAKQAMDIALPF
jgi:hypothetical protein